MQNGLQLNPDKSEVLVFGTTKQLQATSSVTSVTVAGVDLPVADEMKVLGVTLDCRLTFDKHVSAMVRSCNYLIVILPWGNGTWTFRTLDYSYPGLFVPWTSYPLGLFVPWTIRTLLNEYVYLYSAS